MSLTKQHIADALKCVRIAGGDLISTGAFRSASVCEAYVSVKLGLPEATATRELERVAGEARQSVGSAAAGLGVAVQSFIVEFVDEPGDVIYTSRFGRFDGGTGKAALSTVVPATSAMPPAGDGHRPIGGLGAPPTKQPTPQGAVRSLPGVKHTIAVGAGKGGVGKSTIALNIAVGLARRGHAVGLMDGDIYGPSLPTMLNLHALETAVLAGRLQPFLVHGVKAMTIGKLVDPEKPLIWRGPMAHGAFKQLAEQTNWGELDYLIIDLPPGTGDVPLTMAQLMQLTGAVVVCTPQKVAQDDAVRATKMFQQLGIEVLGVVENMSYFVGDPDRDGVAKEYDIFGRGGAEAMAQRLNVPFLGSVPITMALRKNSDSGDPTSNFTAGGALAAAFEEVLNNLESQVALAALRQGSSRPSLTIS